jgi:hypothetical protein
MHSVGVDQAMPFEATLTNAIPPGEIDTVGNFGPWHRGEPGETPLDGKFRFDKADLGVFKGISGILSAHGTFGGVLGRIDIHGETTTPDFTVKVGNHPVPLQVAYHAIVDGTNGDTILERIEASFLKTAIVARGGVIDLKGKQGREVALDVTIDRGRLEDVLKLAVKANQPPMLGALKMTTRFVLPPGDRDVVEKLRLKGKFSISGGRFASNEVQQKINELSRRGRGKTVEEVQDQRITSDFSGEFTLADGMLSLPFIAFDVPGAGVRLAGQYDLRREIIDFKGELLLDAKVSETVGGVKGFFLKVVDPLFRRNGRTVIPIKITGTRSAPSFGMDARRILKRG